jgi:hypothetical protein
MIVLGPIVALTALWLLGALALDLAGARRTTGIEVLVLDFVAGVVILAAIGMTTIALGGRLAIAPFYQLLGGLAAVALWRNRPRRPGTAPGTAPGAMPGADPGTRPSRVATLISTLVPALRPPRTRRARALLAGVAVILLVLAASAAQDRLVWDGWAFWTLKARILFEEGTLPATVLDPAGPYPYAHPDYPLAVPLLDWWLYRHAGAVVPALASLAGTLWFATLPALVWTALRQRLGDDAAALATLGTTAFWPLAFYAAGGYADVVITLALLGAVLELERARPHGHGDFDGDTEGDGDGASDGEPGAPIRLALYLTLAALAKNEGLALALVGAAVALGTWRRDGWRRYGWRLAGRAATLALPFLLAAPWLLLARRLGLAPEHLAGVAPTLGDARARVTTIVAALGRLLLSRAWIPLPFLVLTALYAAARRRRLAAPAGWALVACYGAVIGGVYLTTRLELAWLLGSTLDRMVGDLVPAIVVLSLWEIWGARSRAA